jgi:hypothetical protein
LGGSRRVSVSLIGGVFMPPIFGSAGRRRYDAIVSFEGEPNDGLALRLPHAEKPAARLSWRPIIRVTEATWPALPRLHERLEVVERRPSERHHPGRAAGGTLSCRLLNEAESPKSDGVSRRADGAKVVDRAVGHEEASLASAE